MEKRFIYRSSLKNRDIPRFQMMGISSELILSKHVFLKNTDISKFLKLVFNTDFKEYVMKSRTLILARTIRIIDQCTDQEYELYRKKLLFYIEDFYYYDELQNNKYSRSPISKWVTGEQIDE